MQNLIANILSLFSDGPMNFIKNTLMLCLCISFTSCFTLKTEHHITLDHNITIKVEKEVNDFVDDLYSD